MSRYGNVGDGIASHVCPGSPGEDAAALGGALARGVGVDAAAHEGAGASGAGLVMAGRGHGSGDRSGSVGCSDGISGAGVGWVTSGESDGRGLFGEGEGVGSAKWSRKQRSGRRPLPRESMVTEPPKMGLVPDDGARRMWARSRAMAERVAQVS